MSRSKKIAVVLAVPALFCAALAVWSYVSPWIALSRIQAAAAAGDSVVLSEMVDWDAVRGKLTIDLAKRELHAQGVRPGESRVAPVVLSVEALVDKIANPAGIIDLAKQSREKGEKLRIKGAYLDLGSYIFAVENESTKSAISLVLKRLGFSSWRVSQVILLDPILTPGGH